MQLGHAILVSSGVRPVPATLAVDRKPLGIKLPDLVEISVDSRIDIFHKRVVSGIEGISPETIPSDGVQDLHRKLLEIVGARDGGIHDAIGLLPSDEFHDALPGQPVSLPVEHVEGLVQFVDLVSPPLGPLTVGTVVIGVPHTDIKGPLGLLPVFIEKRIGAGEGPGELRIVTSLPELDIQDCDLLRKDIIQHLTVHPTEALIFLDTVLGDVLGAHAFGVGDHVVVGMHRNHLSFRSLDFEPG